MLRSENVATPLTNDTVFVPDSVPGTSSPPFFPIAIVTEPEKVVIVWPRSSSAATCTGGLIVIKGNVVVGCVVNPRCVAAGLRTTAEASQLPGCVGSKYQVHCGLTVPPLENSAWSACIVKKLSVNCASRRNGIPDSSATANVTDLHTS